ncbi:MAG: lamin tail domain-containing protein [Candidatus Marinimicrobia bacterium]|nr:lamin tail domain-containing protein [Candidatus Neomarinimicrobiota bacterium]
MKKTHLAITWLLLITVLFGGADHLLISEIVLQPSTSEYFVIYNPTDNSIDLTDYYITDATDPANQLYYYNLPTAANYRSTSSRDFTARFPAGSSIDAKSSLVVCIPPKASFTGTHVVTPDLSIKEDFLPAIDGQSTIGGAPYYLDNTAETLVLFKWDGSASTVQDVDYILWGSNDYAVDKSGISTYQNDTPAAQQKFAPIHVDGQKLKRVAEEGSETQSGGNGITGHDETSENLDETWAVVSISNTKPKISGVTISPASPVIGDAVTVSATVADDSLVVAVNLVTIFQSVRATQAMILGANDIFSVTVGPFNTAATLDYYIVAEDVTGLKDSTLINSVDIQEPPEVITIRTIRDNWNSWNGETVTLNGVVSIGSNVLRTDRTSAYMQDQSGSGLNLFDYNITDLMQGDSIEITGTLEEYQGVIELTGWGSSYTVIAISKPIPAVQEISIAALNDAPTYWEGSYFQISGTVAERADNIGGGSNIIIEDVTGRTTVRIWNSTNALFNSLEVLVNEELDGLLQPGNMVSVKGVGSIYNNSPQVLLGYAEDVEYYVSGEPGNEKTKLSVAPYPFVPQLGEVIKYSYEYPSNCRVILRVYDMSGRFITTLEDGYYALSWHKENVWDGRNELNELVAPGNYLFHLQTTNRTTGKTRADIVPVVVGVKF